MSDTRETMMARAAIVLDGCGPDGLAVWYKALAADERDRLHAEIRSAADAIGAVTKVMTDAIGAVAEPIGRILAAIPTEVYNAIQNSAKPEEPT